MDREKTIEIPVRVLEDIYDTLRIHRNNMIDAKQTQSSLWRMTNHAMNWLSCHIQGKVTDENADRIILSYFTGTLLKF